MRERVRWWWWHTIRQRQTAAVLVLFYLTGWAIGRLGGKIEVLERYAAGRPEDA